MPDSAPSRSVTDDCSIATKMGIAEGASSAGTQSPRCRSCFPSQAVRQREPRQAWGPHVKKMIDEGNNIKYVVFDKGTVWPEGVTGGMEHMQTWKVAYYIEGVRDWLFAQKK